MTNEEANKIFKKLIRNCEDNKEDLADVGHLAVWMAQMRDDLLVVRGIVASLKHKVETDNPGYCAVAAGLFLQGSTDV